MNNKIKQFATLLFALLLSLSTLGLPAFADGKDIPTDMDRTQYYKDDMVLAKGKLYHLPEHSKMRVEEGATLYVEGEYQVKGTLKNYGTIIVRDVAKTSNKKEVGEQDYTGHMTIVGTFENYGKVVIENGTFENQPTGTITNSGDFLITNTKENLTTFHNVSRTTSKGVQGGTFVNEKTGTFRVANEVGTGFQNMTDAVFENKGVFAITPLGVAKGKITGNQPVSFTYKEQTAKVVAPKTEKKEPEEDNTIKVVTPENAKKKTVRHGVKVITGPTEEETKNSRIKVIK